MGKYLNWLIVAGMVGMFASGVAIGIGIAKPETGLAFPYILVTGISAGSIIIGCQRQFLRRFLS